MVPSSPTKRADQMICGSNVRGVNLTVSVGAVLLSARPPKKPAAPAAKISATANGHAAGRLARASARGGRHRARRAGERFEREAEIACRLKALRRNFLEGTAN